jgi:hypothetical protein
VQSDVTPVRSLQLHVGTNVDKSALTLQNAADLRPGARIDESGMLYTTLLAGYAQALA